MNDLLNLNILYRLPADGRSICLDDLASILKSAGFSCTRTQIADGLGYLCEQGMAVHIDESRFARADLYHRGADGKRSFAELMAQIATTLIHNDSEALEGRINNALQDVAQFTGADRAYVFEYDFEHELTHYRYEWCALGVSAQASLHASVPIAALTEDEWVDTHQQGAPVVVNDVGELLNPALRRILIAQDIKSLILVPIMADAQCLGFIGFDSVRHHRQYGEEDVRLLQTLARMLANLHWKRIDRLALARVHDNLNIIVEGTGVGTWVWWMNTGRLEINDTWAGILGYSRAELEPATVDTWERLTHPEDLAEARKLISQYLDGKLEYYDTQFRMRHKDGRWVRVLARARLIQRDPAEGPVMVGVHHDVTELEQTYRELRLLSEVINRSPVVAARWRDEPGYPIEYMSLAISGFGYTAEEFISGHTKYHELIHPDDLVLMRGRFRDRIDDSGTYRTNYRLRHRQGHWIWVEETGWLSDNHNSSEINCVLLDVTQSRQLELELKLHATLINNSMDVIALIGPDLRYRIANQGYLNIIGKTMAEVIGCTKDEIFGRSLPAEYLDVFKHNLRQALQLKRDESMLVEERVPDIGGGPVRTFRSRYFPVFDEQTSEFQGIALLAVEITDLKRAQAALSNSESRFRLLLENLPNVAVQGYDQNKRIIFWNRGSEVIYGYSAREAMGRSLIDLVIPAEQQAQFSELTDRWIAGEITLAPMEVSVCNKQGEVKHVLSSQTLQESPSGETEFYCIDVDLTAQKLAQQRLELLARAFSHSYDGVLIMDGGAVLVEVNDRYCEMTGYSRAELLGRKSSILHSEQYDKAFHEAIWAQLGQQGYWVGETRNHKKSGEPYSAEIRVTALTDGNGAATNYIANVTDITDRLSYEEKLKNIAFYDQLTGLPNRSSVSEALRQAIAKHKHFGNAFAVVFIDLDEFKAINDSHGHDVGDRYLQNAAKRLQSILREGDVAARFGGDEFVLILQSQKPDVPSHPAFDRLLTAMRDPVVIDGKSLRLTASFGVTFYPQDNGIDADQLLRQADQAMYSAKQHGKNQIVYFDAEFERSIMLRSARVAELRQAIEHGELMMHYQPQVDMSTGRVFGVEALLRWNHPSAGLLYPAKFLDLIQGDEQLGLLLSRWVLARALGDLEHIRNQGHDVGISVNIVIPTEDGLRAVFLNDLHDMLRRNHNIPPNLLTLEVVENILIHDLSQATKTIHKIQQLGVQISLDDFGTGFSSLSYLKHLSFDELKIDQEFVRDMLSDQEDMTIVQAVVSLSQSFDVSVIGEGVETARHAEMLLRLGCVKAQGYAISRPLAIDALETWLEQWRPDPTWRHIAPISPHHYQIVANLSGYAGWVATLEQYLHGQSSEAPDWNFRACNLLAQLKAGADTQDLWEEASQHQQTMLDAGTAALRTFQEAGLDAQAEQHMKRVAGALQGLQKLVWARLIALS